LTNRGFHRSEPLFPMTPGPSHTDRPAPPAVVNFREIQRKRFVTAVSAGLNGVISM
jgi:hypothetical protein